MPTKSFFTEEEIESTKAVKVNLDEGGPHCIECGLYKNVRTPRMKYTGDGRLNALIVGEAPGDQEDRLGKQFIRTAPAGGYLWNAFGVNHMNIDTDFYKTNAVCCRPTTKGTRGGVKNRAPERKELIYCKPILEQTIKETDPKYILLMGGKAVESFYHESFKNTSITRWRGLAIPDQKYRAWILPLFHPSYITRDDKNDNLKAAYARDVMNVAKFMEKGDHQRPDKIDYDSRVKIITDYSTLISFLNRIIKHPPEYLEFDYETTGLKPFRPGHKILSISMCFDPSVAYSFPFQYRDYWSRSEFIQIKRRIRKILTDYRIRKLAHNIKFEDIWSSEILGVEVEDWYWDSMIAAHILDNRSGYSGLKFQTYLNFGFYPYDAPVQRYIKGFPFNKMEECPLTDLLHYGGLDALFGFMLEPIQKVQIEKRKLEYPYDFFHEGTIALADIEKRGVCTDEEYYERMSNKQGTGEIDDMIVELLKRTKFGKDAERFKEVTGKELDIDSPKDLGKLFYEILKYPAIKTEKGNYSVDEKALKKINLHFVKDLLELRKLLKIRGTYLAQFKRFSYNGKMNPSYDLTIPVSYRGSSSDPNFQNIPNRDELAKTTCRKGIIPRPGRGLLSSDFSGIEVAISACYNKDPELIKYITDEKTDMHRDAAADIWLLPKQEITKKIRYSGKNGWVFPQFYGSYYKNCAPDLWENYLDLETASGVTLQAHLAKKGIKTLEAFVRHCKGVEDKFWGQRFKVYKDWKDAINAEYRKKGYISSYLGFQFTGYMTRNECTNYQTQGTAFHMLLWTLIEMEKIAMERDWESFIIGQIHDDMIHDYVEEELHEIVETIDMVGTEQILEAFPWITVPLKIEHEISGIDGNWAEMEEYRYAA